MTMHPFVMVGPKSRHATLHPLVCSPAPNTLYKKVTNEKLWYMGDRLSANYLPLAAQRILYPLQTKTRAFLTNSNDFPADF
jgi:hypothetical protein